jgi:hypothetical protein
MERKSEKVTVVIDPGDDRPFADILEQCKQAGLEVETELEEIGVLIGSIDADRMKRLDQVSGVVAIERERSYQLPPPESEIQDAEATPQDPRRPR